MATLLQDALAAEYSILSSAGSHAREDWRTIITRKSADIAQAKHSVWVLNSNAARPDTVQSFCNKQGARYVIFLSRERDSKVRSGPSTEHRARETHPDGGGDPNGKFVTFFNQLTAKNGERTPAFDHSSQRAYWAWFKKNFDAGQAVEIIEKASTEYGKVEWIDFGVPLNDAVDTMHLQYRSCWPISHRNVCLSFDMANCWARYSDCRHLERWT
jgi:hypothetical protein